jgi:acyl carrier protein
MDDPIADRILGILAEHFGIDRAQLAPEMFLTSDLSLDSLDAVELIMAFEDALEITIPDEDAEQIKTVGDLIDYLKRRLDDEGDAGVPARLKPHPPEGPDYIDPPHEP